MTSTGALIFVADYANNVIRVISSAYPTCNCITYAPTTQPTIKPSLFPTAVVLIQASYPVLQPLVVASTVTANDFNNNPIAKDTMSTIIKTIYSNFSLSMVLMNDATNGTTTITSITNHRHIINQQFIDTTNILILNYTLIFRTKFDQTQPTIDSVTNTLVTSIQSNKFTSLLNSSSISILNSMKSVNIPQIFQPKIIDIYPSPTASTTNTTKSKSKLDSTVMIIVIIVSFIILIGIMFLFYRLFHKHNIAIYNETQTQTPAKSKYIINCDPNTNGLTNSPINPKDKDQHNNNRNNYNQQNDNSNQYNKQIDFHVSPIHQSHKEIEMFEMYSPEDDIPSIDNVLTMNNDGYSPIKTSMKRISKKLDF